MDRREDPIKNPGGRSAQMMNSLRFVFNRLADFLIYMKSNRTWRFDEEVEQFARAYRYNESDQKVLEQGLQGDNPDVILLCALLYPPDGNRKLLLDGLFRAAQAGRLRLREAAFEHLSRVPIPADQGESLLPYISVEVYDGLPVELFAALNAVSGPKEAFIEQINAHWHTLRRHFLVNSHHESQRLENTMKELWRLCRGVETQAARSLRRRALTTSPTLVDYLPSPRGEDA